MDVLTIIISIVNLIFAALGIFVTAETLKLRASERNYKDNATTSASNEIDGFKEGFPKKFAESRMGSKVVEAEFLHKKSDLDPKKSKIITMYRNQGYIKLSRIFHANVFWDEKENHLAFTYYQLFLFFTPILFIVAAFPFGNEEMVLILLSMIFIVYILPFGIYGDLDKNSKAKVIFSFFSLGRVRKTRCIIEEQVTDDYLFIIYFEIKFLGLIVKIPKQIKAKSIEDGVLEYLIVKKFSNPEETKISYRCLGVNDIEKTSHVFINDIRYGWIRVIHLISSIFTK